MRSTILCFLVLLIKVSHSQEFVESQPVGGRFQLKEFINQELIYPESAYNNEIEGKVFFIFDVDEKGHTLNLRDFTYPDSSTLNEAMRIFRLVEWVPASRGGVHIKDMNHFEVEFDIKKYNRLCKSRGYKTILNPYEPVDSSGKIMWYRNLDEAPHPIFANKKDNLASFIAANIKYPELAIRQNVTGVVKMSFVVETNGRISNLEIVNSVGAGCNEEAIRLLKMIKWMPGILGQKAVRTRTSMTINFNLDRGQDGIFNPVVKSSYGG